LIQLRAISAGLPARYRDSKPENIVNSVIWNVFHIIEGMGSSAVVSEHIEQREGVYYVPGTRVSLDSLVYAFREGSSPENIREDFDGLTLADVYGAIAFYLHHQTEVDAYLLQRREQWAELERQGTPASPSLKARVEHARQNAPLPRQ